MSFGSVDVAMLPLIKYFDYEFAIANNRLTVTVTKNGYVNAFNYRIILVWGYYEL